MAGVGSDNVPTFTKGEPVSAGKLNQMGDVVRRMSAGPGQYSSSLFNVSRKLPGGGGGGDTTTNVNSEVVHALIDKDIEGSTEGDSVSQPNTDPAGDPLLLWPVHPRVTKHKYFRAAEADRAMFHGTGTCPEAAGSSTTITLADDAIAVNEYYVGGDIELTGGTGSGQTKTITAYNGTTKVATVGTAWTTNPDDDTTYAITKDDPGYKPPQTGTATAGGTNTITLESSASDDDDYYVGQTIDLTAGPGMGDQRVITGYVGSTRVATVDEDWSATPTTSTDYSIPILTLILDFEEVETVAGPPAEYETRYKTKTFYLRDGKGIEIDDYTRAEYEAEHDDLDENEHWDDVKAEAPEDYYKRRYRAPAVVDKQGRLWLSPKDCEPLPPPPRPEVS